MAVRILALLSAALTAAALLCGTAHADTIKALVQVEGAPENQLVGFGLVVGLSKTGDQTTQVPYTNQAIQNMLRHMGILMTGQSFMQPQDVASVMVTASVPPYAHRGQRVDVTVAAVGNAQSLQGGVLLPTPLKGGNGLVYAQAQGPLIVSGFAVQAAGSLAQTNTPTVGRVPDGAILSQSIPTDAHAGNSIQLLLDRPSYETSTNIAERINAAFGLGSAEPSSPGVVRLPNAAEFGTAEMAELMNLQVQPGTTPPQVVIDAGSGTIVMGAGVQLGPAVVSHGDLTVSIQAINGVAQPAPFSRGRTARVTNARVAAGQNRAHVVNLPHATTLADVARALNAVGATPDDLIAIVEALHQAGALKAKLKVI